MTRSVTLYGFGSAFDGNKTASDVDILVVHESYDCTCCQLAIECKRRLGELIERAHITMLSESEETHFQFIKTARAVRLGVIREGRVENDMTILDASIPKLA